MIHTHTYSLGEWKKSGATVYRNKAIVAVAYCEGNRELHPSISSDDILPDSEGKIGNGWEEAWANARLISAAPDLLDALEDAEFLLRKAGNIPGPMQDSFKRSANDARRAIAKARGDA